MAAPCSSLFKRHLVKTNQFRNNVRNLFRLIKVKCRRDFNLQFLLFHSYFWVTLYVVKALKDTKDAAGNSLLVIPSVFYSICIIVAYLRFVLFILKLLKWYEHSHWILDHLPLRLFKKFICHLFYKDTWSRLIFNYIFKIYRRRNLISVCFFFCQKDAIW